MWERERGGGGGFAGALGKQCHNAGWETGVKIIVIQVFGKIHNGFSRLHFGGAIIICGTPYFSTQQSNSGMIFYFWAIVRYYIDE